MTRSVSSLTRHKIAALLPTQLPAVVSTVVAAQKKSKPPGSTTAGLPFRTPSISSVPEKKIFVKPRKLPPVVPSQLTAPSTDLQSGTPPCPRITIIIPRKISAVACRKQKSQTIFLTTMPHSAESAAPVMVSSPQLISSSQESSISVDTRTVLNEVAAISSQKKDLATNNLESPKQTAAVLEPINAPPETCSSSNKSVELVPTSISPAGPPIVEKKRSAVVRLTRLPFPVSAKEAVLISRLPTDGSSESQSIVKEGTTQEKPLSMVISTQSSKTLVLSSDSCPILKETSVFQEESPDRRPSTGEPTSNSDEGIISSAVQDCASPNDPPIEEKQSATVLHLTPITTKDTSDPHEQMTKAQFLAQLAVTPVPQDPNEASSNDPVDASTSCAETSTSAKKRLQNKSLVARLRSHLKTHLKARRKETNPEPCTETETIAVDPKNRKLENDSPNNINSTTGPSPLSLKDPGVVEDVTSPKTTTNDHAPISPRSSGLCEADATPKSTVSEPTSVRSVRFKATRKSTPVSPSLGADGVGSKTKKSTSVSPRRSTAVEESASPKKTKSTLLSPRRSNSTKQSASPKKINSTSLSPRRSYSTKQSATPKKTKSTSVSPNRASLTKQSARPKKTKSTSLSPRRSNSIKQSASPKKTKSISVSPRRSNSTEESAHPKKTKSTSLSPTRSNPTKQSATPKKTKCSSESPRRSDSTKQCASSKSTKNISLCPRKISSPRDGASPKNGASSKSIKNTPVNLKRTNSGRDGAISKKIKSTVSPRMSILNKNSTSPKVSTYESTSFCRRKCTLKENGSSSKQTKRESNSFSPRSSITTDDASAENTAIATVSPNVSVSRRKTKESTPAKKPTLIKDGISPDQNFIMVDAKMLAKVTKANTIAKMKKSSQTKLQNGGKTGQLAGNRVSCETVRKCTSKAVWTPPRMLTSKTPPAGDKQEAASPITQDHVVVYPPSVTLRPIPVRAPPVVSPLQPLSVIGRRLLKNQCGECGRVLSSVAALESHVSLHAGRRPFSCTLCGKRFPDSKGLKRHGRVHRNGRIHICQQCGKGFVYRFGLTKHLQMVHRKIKPFICQICNKGYFTKRDVEAHIRIHTGEKPFHCNLCEKKFARRVELNVHLRWHNGEKRHWCPYCGKGFLDFNNLKRHKYIHTGEKPHSCPHCPKNFSQSGHLKKHVRNVHKIL